MTVSNIREFLFAQQDTCFRDFQSKLMPTVDKGHVIGVRTPILRKFAKTLAKEFPETAEAFLQSLPHTYFEENSLHAFLIEGIRDFDACIAAVNAFLPYVDNWATCDQMSPKVLGKHPEALLIQIRHWLASDQTYTVRFGIRMLMTFYLDAHFRTEYTDMVAALRTEEYYINMMIAWYFATALAKQYDAALPYLEQRRLDVWCHNKAIQKAVESYRITAEQKAYLRTLRL